MISITNVKEELKKLGLDNSDIMDIKEMRNKDGIYLFRIVYKDDYFILKYFENEAHRREISNYNLLKSLNIPTIKVIAQTNKSLLLEDLERSQTYRLGENKDLSDVEVAKSIARWYVKLHSEGASYLKENTTNLYSELNLITKENIELIKSKSNTYDNTVWELILSNLDLIYNKIESLEKTLTYNDFYWTNLAVKKDKKEALMFDYNFLGTSFRYSDIRNVCSSLSPEAAKAFIKEYGKFDEYEKTIDNGVSMLFDLIMAYSKAEFPVWGKDALETVYNGELEQSFKKILANE